MSVIETYEKPEIEISVFDANDIVTVSTPTVTTTQGDGNFGDFD